MLFPRRVATARFGHFFLILALCAASALSGVGVRPALATPIGCDEASLNAAILAIGSGSGVIELASPCTITLSGTLASGGLPYDGPGPTGLPPITGNLTIF